jgi:hypothetical protein
LGVAGSFVAPYRPYFVTLALVSLAWTFYRAFRLKLRAAQENGVLMILGALRPTNREAPVFWMAAIVILLVLFPYWGAPLFVN